MSARSIFLWMTGISLVANGIGFQSTCISGHTALRSTHAPTATARKRMSSMKETEQPEPSFFNTTVEILAHGEHYIVASKPPAVVCHHSDWCGSKSAKNREPVVPMLQRVREAVGERVNLVHRLDRGASGCLLFTKAASDAGDGNATAALQEAMTRATKTYVALVRGEGILKGRDFKNEGWFEVSRPIKDESGQLNDATTLFRFIAGQDNANGTIDRPRASLVLCRPKTGRWHQIRRHLNGLSHPILGDSSHGNSRLNREWREQRGLIPERTCLHLLKLELPPTNACPDGISTACPLADDMVELLEKHLPKVFQTAERIMVEEEGMELRYAESAGEQVPIQLRL